MRICVAALEKIGLPLAVQFADKRDTVVGADMGERVVGQVNRGVEPFPGGRTSSASSCPLPW